MFIKNDHFIRDSFTFMVKFIKQLLKIAIGSDEEFSFEERLIISYVLYASIACFLSVFTNMWLSLGTGLVTLLALSTIIFSTAYYLGRFKGRVWLTRLIFTIFTLIFCNVYWYLNFGSYGSAIYFFAVYFFILMFAWETNGIRIIGLVVVANILLLMFLELLFPGIIPDYPSEKSRIVDVYMTFIILLGFFTIIILNAKNNYIKQYKMAQKADKLKSAFLANMSHEIRTPLNAIVGFSQLLTERDLPKEKRERYSNLITENGDYLMKLISDILDVSMIESGHLSIVKSRVNLNKLLNQIYSIHNEMLQAKAASRFDLLLEIPAKTTYIEVDEMRLKQVIFNLIGNAIKYTTKGYIKIGYSVSEQDIIFFVEDTGCGIKEEFQPEVFSRFVRHEDSREVKTTRGSGIGLSLSKELVHILGGRIWFTSKYKEGTTFYFSVPLTMNPKVAN